MVASLLTRVTAGAAAALAMPALASATFLTNDFNSDTVGSQPTSVTVISPTANTGTGSTDGDIGVVTVGNSAIGGGNALRIYDRSTTNFAHVRDALTAGTASGMFGFNFTAGPNLVSNHGDTYLRVAMGNAGADASSSFTGNNFQRVVISSTGTGTTGQFQASNSTGNPVDTNVATFIETASNLVELYFNRTASALGYAKGVAQTVAAGRYDVWLNGVLVANDFSLRTGTSDILAVSLATGGSQKGPDWIIDNLSVAAIPEPASIGLLALSAVIAFGRRR